MAENLLEIKNLYAQYVTDNGITGQKQVIHAVNGVNLKIQKGEILALAGESGCGKSTLAKTIIKLENVKSGEIIYDGRDVLKMSNKELKDFRKKVQMIFQNPYASLNPKMKIIDILKEPLDINTKLSEAEKYNIINEKIQKTGIDISSLNQFPHEFSGGQRQRIAIARSLVMAPEFILADEPVSALDVSIQAQIINLLKELKQIYNLTFLLITHDMSVIRYLADRVAIMYLGEIIETGSTNQIFINPKHPYTKALIASAPKIGELKEQKKEVLTGELPSPSNLPKGCKFHTRCPYCMDVCKCCSPTETEIFDGHKVKCFLYLNK